MMRATFQFIIIVTVLGLWGCANIVPPEGGKKDTTPPKLVAISPADSQLNTRVSKIELRFNEYIELNNASTEVQISPLLQYAPVVTNAGKRVTVKIADSLLLENTTYRISMNSSIKDLHEGNLFPPYSYTFSTGSYFDSLSLSGTVYDAATGLADSSSFILLYSAAKSDSAVVKEKPLYVAKTTGGGMFSFKGLPGNRFRIYALHDGNNNLVYDGGTEMIGFANDVIVPGDTAMQPIVLKVFKEVVNDTFTALPTRKRGGTTKSDEKKAYTYSVAVDTTSRDKRTVEVVDPIKITFDRQVDTLNSQRIFLSYDSLGTDVETVFTVERDTVRKEQLILNTAWKEDALYTLRLLKGFAKDSLGNEAMPSRYTFRTKNDDDYAKLTVNIPPRYKADTCMFMVTSETDTIYNRQITDTVVKLVKLKPGAYKMRIIIDKNKNGKWDTGDLFGRIQPENVIPYLETISLKASWDNTVDFEPVPKKPSGKKNISPQTRDKPPVRE